MTSVGCTAKLCPECAKVSPARILYEMQEEAEDAPGIEVELALKAGAAILVLAVVALLARGVLGRGSTPPEAPRPTARRAGSSESG